MAARSRSHYIPVSTLPGVAGADTDDDTTAGTHHVNLRRSTRARLLLVGALVAAAPVVSPAVSGASPQQQPPPSGGETDRTDTTLQVETDDVLRADSSEVTASLADLGAEVTAQVAAVGAARAAAATADAELQAADAAVTTTEEYIAALTVESDQVVVDSFINPPTEDAMDTLAAESLAESTVRQSLLDTEADANADVLTELEAAQDELDARRQAQDDAAAEAEARSEEAAAALEDLISVQSGETLFVINVQDRVAANLAEASSLESVDPAAADALRAREGEIAALIGNVTAAREQRAAEAALQQAMADAAARAAADAAARSSRPSGGVSIGPASGNLATVSCPGGGEITVDSSMAGNLRSMLAAAAADGDNMCGGGYRDPAAQIALRRANCGSSSYAIYEAPSSSCSPPTAPPGTSNHEQGLAVDFTCNGGGALSRSSSCFTWLKANAAGYGFYNLPSEPWHWSNDGT